MPVVSKNVLDVASRPFGKSGWNEKIGGIVSIFTENIGILEEIII
ncbi:hypothetical protein [Miniphocaeibacter massiliensis]